MFPTSLAPFPRYLFFWNTSSWHCLHFPIPSYLGFSLHPSGLETFFFFFKCLSQAQIKAEASTCTENKRCDLHSAQGVLPISMSWHKDCTTGSNQRLIWQCPGTDNRCLGISKRTGDNIVILYSKHFLSNGWFVVPEPSASLLAFRSPQWISFLWCHLVKYWPVVLNPHKPSALSLLWLCRAWLLSEWRTAISACFEHAPGGFMWSPCGRWITNSCFLIFSITLLTSYPLSIFSFFLNEESYSNYSLYRH